MARISACIVKTEDRVTLQSIESHLNSAISIFQALQVPQQSIVLNHNHPHNKDIPKQRSFFSTKKRKPKAQIRLAKPDKAKKEQICKLLKTNDLYNGKRLISSATIGKSSMNSFLLFYDPLGALKWMCLQTVINRVVNGGEKIHEVEINLHDLPEEIIDANVTEMKNVMTAEAHSLFEKKGK